MALGRGSAPPHETEVLCQALLSLLQVTDLYLCAPSENVVPDDSGRTPHVFGKHVCDLDVSREADSQRGSAPLTRLFTKAVLGSLQGKMCQRFRVRRIQLGGETIIPQTRV